LIILGLHTGHDGSVCVVKDGRLVVALSSERITRQKKSGGVPNAVLDAVLDAGEVRLADIDAIAMTDWYRPWAAQDLDIECFAEDEIPTDVNGQPHRKGDSVHDTWDRIWDDEVYRLVACLRNRSIPVYNIGHHKAHCASAFYTSPFKDAWCMSMDSSGAKPKNNFMVARGSGKRLDWLDTELCMIGVAYGHVCDQLAIGSQMYKAGSLMALAGYGTVLPWVRERINCLRAAPFFSQTGDYHKWLKELWRDLSGGKTFTKETSDSQEARDIAASIQFLFEEAVLEAVRRIPDDGCTRICLAGGSFLNCNVNSRIREESRFERVHLFPGCGDDGCAIGAALYTAHAVFGEKQSTYNPSQIAYLGPVRGDSKVPDYKRVARAIADGKVVAWFDGRSEYGPRALGHRSMLADPRTIESRYRINDIIKKREWYRPLSPSVLAEKSAEWFDFDGESPFMLFTARCKRPEEIPAVVHVDGTARMQTVRRADNPHFYALIREFEKLTGVPMLLNTSLNVDGQPILETRADAVEFWERGVVDMMVVNSEIWERECTSN
jgi:carbamoyltransferase